MVGKTSWTLRRNFSGQMCQAPKGCGNRGFQPLADQAGQSRGKSAGRNRNDDGGAVEDRGKDEVAEVGLVHHVQRDATHFGQGGERGREGVVVGGVHHEGDAVQVGWREVGCGDLMDDGRGAVQQSRLVGRRFA